MAVFKQGPRPEENFVMISNELARNPEISIEAKGIYMFMRSHRDGWNMTVVRIANAVGVSKGRAAKYINELIDTGYIVRSQSSGQGGRFGEIEYLILTSPRLKNPDTVDPSTAKPDTGNRPTKEDYSSKKTSSKEDQSPKGDDGASAAGGEQPPLIDPFDEWWKHVNKKESKGDARNAFKAALKKSDLQSLINGIERSQEYWKSLGRSRDKTPHPATWLRAEGWLDDIPDVSAPAPSPEDFDLDQILSLMQGGTR